MRGPTTRCTPFSGMSRIVCALAAAASVFQLAAATCVMPVQASFETSYVTFAQVDGNYSCGIFTNGNVGNGDLCSMKCIYSDDYFYAKCDNSAQLTYLTSASAATTESAIRAACSAFAPRPGCMCVPRVRIYISTE